MLKRIVSGAVAVVLVPGMALAAHGKAGLWSSTTTMTMQGAAPQSRTSTYCMTPAQVQSNDPVAERNPNCTYTNVQVQGQTFTADMVCHGEYEATGHFSTTYDSDTHYTATISIATGGMSMTNSVVGTWVRSDCTGADH